ncbi:MAG TPA: hypothetical protein VFH73_18595 [Polyangia bacterium]|jgi:hypothetical protein|nr:hypothetical protein [Polyangia bacterium]
MNGSSVGIGVVTHGTKGQVARYDTPGRSVIGLWDGGEDGIFAFGTGELSLHFEGASWIEEHTGPIAKKGSRGIDMLYLAFVDTDRKVPAIVALGTSLALERQPDHTWVKPPQAEREKLVRRGQLGTPVKLPAGCYGAGWFWLGRKRGFTYCHDGRSFVVDENGTVPEKGKLPKECKRAIDGLTSAGSELYASCGGKVFRTDAAGWHLFGTVPREKELTSISFADGCIFVTGRRSYLPIVSGPVIGS